MGREIIVIQGYSRLFKSNLSKSSIIPRFLDLSTSEVEYIQSRRLSRLNKFMKVKKIKSHFKRIDPVIYKVILKMKLEVLVQSKSSSGHFSKLCKEIIGQQLGSKSARAIVKRFDKLFTSKKISPENVLTLSDKDLRNVGMSWSKASYIKDLSEKVKSKKVKLNNLHKLGDEQVIEELSKVKGIGPWTGEMFLIFTLGREDIFSHGDYGLKRAVQKLYGFKDTPNEKQINKIVKKWSPYKSYGSLALWRSIDI